MVQITLGAAEPSENRASITQSHFGTVTRQETNYTNFGRQLELTDSNIDKAYEYLGVGSIRYPGGTEGAADFDITNPPHIAGLQRAIEFCQANNMALNFTLNDRIYVRNGEVTLDSARLAELESFIINDLMAYATERGVDVESIKIGNEFSGEDKKQFYSVPGDPDSPNWIGYGNVAAALTNALSDMLDRYSDAATFARPALVIEGSLLPAGTDAIFDALMAAGAASKVDAIDLHGANTSGTLKLDWESYFGSATEASFQDDLITMQAAWKSNPETSHVDFRVDAWSFPKADSATNIGGPSLDNAALAMLQLHTFSLLNIVSATSYLAYGVDNNALMRNPPGSEPSAPDASFDPAAYATAGGEMFRMMGNALIGTQAIALSSTPLPVDEAADSSLTRAFAGDESLVLYVVNRTAGNLPVDLVTDALVQSREAFIGGLSSVSGKILGVSDSALSTSRLGVPVVENVTLTPAQMGAGGTDLTLNAHEVAQITLIAAGTFGTKAANTLTGTSTADVLHGLAGADTLSGSGGFDLLAGGDGNDVLYGGAGNDTLYGGTGGDLLDGGNGADTVSYAYAAAGVSANLTTQAANTGDAAGDIYAGIENLTGSSHADTLFDTTAANRIDGGAGNDVFRLSGGADVVYGGTGIDILVFTGSAAVTLSLTDRSNTGGITFTGIENVTGGTGNDSLTGDENKNRFSGEAGNDTLSGYGGNDDITGGDGNDLLYGGAGDDILRGNQGLDLLNGADGNDTMAAGAGIDTLSGGGGNDSFVFYFASEAGDVITDFSASGANGDDVFLIQASKFGGGLTAGALNADQFVVTTNDNMALDGNDRFIFNSTTKTLWFDNDGRAANAAILIADLQNAAANLTASDIMLF